MKICDICKTNKSIEDLELHIGNFRISTNNLILPCTLDHYDICKSCEKKIREIIKRGFMV